MEQKQGFFRSIGRDNCYIVANLFYAYFAQGVAVIMLGAVLPALKADYALNYQVGGMLLSVQSIWRVTYRDTPDAIKWGIRVRLELGF